MRKLSFTITLIIAAYCSFAQGTFIPLGSDAYGFLDRIEIKYGKIIPIEHTSNKPYLRADAARIAESLLLSNLRFSKVQRAQLQWLVDEDAEWLDSLRSRSKPFLKKLYTEPASFYSVSSKKKGLFDLRINPMIGVELGAESYKSRFIFSRSVGLEVRGDIKQVFSFYFNATGNSDRPPYYVGDKFLRSVNRLYAVPGQSYWKTYSSRLFKFNDGVDYFDARGYININVLKYMNITFGRDKNFIGNGERSLFLSDYSAPYLFLKYNLHFWRVSYQSIFAELTSQYARGGDQLLPKKYMAVHHLSLQATHWLNLGLFESVILNRSNHFELQYLNPIIFYRAVEHSLGSPDNVMIGGDFKANIASRASVYGQLLFDELNTKQFFKGNGWWANKWGAQLGIKVIDIAPNLDGQVEFNYVRPFTYTHPSDINYTNYNQPLAHPLGANFYEIILNLHYQPLPQLTFNVKYFVAVVGDDTVQASNGLLTNLGGDIFMSSDSITQQYHNKVGQGAKGTINYFQFLVSYQPWHNIYLDANILYRSKSTLKSVYNPVQSESSFMVTVGIRMNLIRRNYEF